MLKGSYDNHPDRVRKSVNDLEEVFYRSGIGLRIHGGAEYYLDEYLTDLLRDPLTVFDNVILVESPMRIQGDVIKGMLYRLIAGRKLKPMIAHPERHEAMEIDFKMKPGRFKRFLEALGHRDKSANRLSKSDLENCDIADTLPVSLRRMGCMFQGNIGSFAGIYGDKVRRRAANFLECGLYDCLGTDAHHPKELVKFLKQGFGEIERMAGRDMLTHFLSRKKTEKTPAIFESTAGAGSGNAQAGMKAGVVNDPR